MECVFMDDGDHVEKYNHQASSVSSPARPLAVLTVSKAIKKAGDLSSGKRMAPKFGVPSGNTPFSSGSFEPLKNKMFAGGDSVTSAKAPARPYFGGGALAGSF